MSDAQAHTYASMYYDNYMTLQEVGDAVGVSLQYVHATLKRAGYEMRRMPNNGYKDPRCREKEQFAEFVRSSSTYQEVGDKLGFRWHTAKKWMEFHGFDKEDLLPYRGENHKSWQGGTYEHKGYTWIHCDTVGYREFRPDYRGRYVAIHRVVFEYNILNHNKLSNKYVIHHLDFNKKNNQEKNLVALRHWEHIELHRRCNKLRDQHLMCEIDYDGFVLGMTRLRNLAEIWGAANLAKIKTSLFLKEYDVARHKDPFALTSFEGDLPYILD